MLGFNKIAKSDNPRVLLGIDVLEKYHVKMLYNKRVGLVTNQSGVNSKGVSTIQILKNNPKINLVSLFAPEHGIRGNLPAGKYFKKRFSSLRGIVASSDETYGLMTRSDTTPSKLYGIFW